MSPLNLVDRPEIEEVRVSHQQTDSPADGEEATTGPRGRKCWVVSQSRGQPLGRHTARKQRF